VSEELQGNRDIEKKNMKEDFKNIEERCTHLESSTGAGDTQGHGGSVAHVRVVALGQQRHDAGALFRIPVMAITRRKTSTTTNQ